MSRWFRVHDDLVDDPKIQLLSGDMVKSLLNLWCLASQNDGLLPSMKDMAFKLRMKPQQVAAIIAELSAAELIDEEDGEYRPHNWDKRQYKSDTDKTAAERAKRYRAKQRDGNVSVTRDADRDGNGRSERPDTEAETEQKQSKKDRTPSAVDLAFNDFWKNYPKRDGANPKEPAAKLFRAAVKAGTPPSEIIAGIRNCAVVEAKNVGTPYIPQAVKWLRDQRWKDYQTHGEVQAQSTIDWDAILTSYKRFGVWSKYAGPDLDSPGCRVPADMLAKHGLARSQGQPIETPRLKSMGDLH